MATSVQDNTTAFSKGNSDTNELKAVYGDPLKDYDPKAMIYLWHNANATEISGLDAGVLGNDDFPALVSLQYNESPRVIYHAPNIAAPAAEFNPGGFGDAGDSPDDYAITPELDKLLDVYGSKEEHGSLAMPESTAAKISKQKIGDLLAGQSYAGSGN